MNEATLTTPQRKALVDMLAMDDWKDCLWRSAKKQYEETRNSKKLALVRQTAKKEITDLIDSILSGRERKSAIEDELNDFERRLSKLGFSLDDEGEMSINSSSPLRKVIDKRLDDELGTTDEVLTRRFEAAKFKLWTVPTAEEAERILEPFLNFQLKVK